MSINKLPTIISYWECGQYVGNKGICNVMSRSRFEEISQNLHFSGNTKDDKSYKGYKIRSLINQSFLLFSKGKKLFYETSFLLKMTLFYHIIAYLIYCDFIYTVENKISWETLNFLCFICYVPPTLLQANRLFVTFDSCLK